MKIPVVVALTSCTLACCTLACGGSSPTAEAPSADSERAGDASGRDAAEPPADEGGGDPSEEAAAETGGIPTECASRKDGLCLPPPKFVRKLCEGTYGDVALIMLRGDSPWSRGYLKGRVEAWNASGGASVSGYLEFDEEVLLLRHRSQGEGGMQVSGADGYDALRWNGSCVTLSGGEVTLDAPPRKKHSRVEWKWLGESMREALRKDATINETYLARRKECKGVSMGAVTKKCEQLDQKLVDVIVTFVREGGELGEAEEHP